MKKSQRWTITAVRAPTLGSRRTAGVCRSFRVSSGGVPPWPSPRAISLTLSRRRLLLSIGRPFEPPSDALQSLTICLAPRYKRLKPRFLKTWSQDRFSTLQPPARRRIRASCSFSVLWIPAQFPELNFSGKCCFFSFFFFFPGPKRNGGSRSGGGARPTAP